MTLENSIADIVHQYVELFFRSEILQMYCLKWSYLLKKLLLGVWQRARSCARAVMDSLNSLHIQVCH